MSSPGAFLGARSTAAPQSAAAAARRAPATAAASRLEGATGGRHPIACLHELPEGVPCRSGGGAQGGRAVSELADHPGLQGQGGRELDELGGGGGHVRGRHGCRCALDDAGRSWWEDEGFVATPSLRAVGSPRANNMCKDSIENQKQD